MSERKLPVVPPCSDPKCWESGSEEDCRNCPNKAKESH